MTKIITGHDAIDYAETHGLTLSKYSDPMEGAREMVEIPEAREIAADDPALIWIALPGPTQSAHARPERHTGQPSTHGPTPLPATRPPLTWNAALSACNAPWRIWTA